jgi:hypothetical protein
MSAEIINLRQFRKQRARDEKAAEAAENRSRFGRTKAERALEEQSLTRAGKMLDDHLLGPGSDAHDDTQPLEPPAPKPPR